MQTDMRRATRGCTVSWFYRKEQMRLSKEPAHLVSLRGHIRHQALCIELVPVLCYTQIDCALLNTVAKAAYSAAAACSARAVSIQPGAVRPQYRQPLTS